MGFFKRMLRKADHNAVHRYKTKRMPWHLLAPRVRAALRELRDVLATETRSAMALYAPVDQLPVRCMQWEAPMPKAPHLYLCVQADAGWEHAQEDEQEEGMDDRFLEQEEG